MKTIKSILLQITKRIETLLYIIVFIAVLSLFGLLSGKIGLSSYSLKFIPIAYSSAVLLIILSILSLAKIYFEKSRLIKSIVMFSAIIIVFYCGLIFLNFIFNFTWEPENIFIRNPQRFGNVLTGRMSPITSILFIFISIGIISFRQNNSSIIRNTGGSFSLLVFLASSVLLIGYLYKAPLLYGSQIIPVSLPSAVCIFLFSITLLRLSEFKLWAYKLIKENPITRQLLKAFLPSAVFTLLLMGFLLTNLSVRPSSLSLFVSLIIIFVVAVIMFVVIKVSGNIGDKLHEAEQSLRESENKYRNLVDNLGEGIGLVNTEEEFLFTNSAAERIFGVGKGELLARNLKDFYDEEQLLIILNQTNLRKTGQSSQYEIELTLPDGKKRIILVTAVPQYNDNNNFVGTLGIFIDITERKENEMALKTSEEKIRSIMENSADAIFITNQQGKYEYTNKAASIMLGYTLEELTNKTFADISPPDKVEEYFEIFKKILSGHKKVLTEIELLKKDGSYISTDLSAVLLPDGTIYGSCRDISERKLAEQVIKASEKRLIQLNADKDLFISILGHDLKSPFNNILGLSGLLAEDIHKLKTNEIENIANDILKSAKITNKLLEDILMWARTQQGSIPFKPQNISLSATCRNILEVLNPGANAKNITLNDSSAEYINIYADPDMLKTILLNLMSNAIKFTNNGGKITISAEQSSDNVTLSVSDNGIGIPPDNLAKLFEISEVLTTKGTANESGTGLGLLLCKEFVEKHGGKMWVESEVGRGSNFKFSLPKFTDQTIQKIIDIKMS